MPSDRPHQPVLVAEVVELLRGADAVVDATLGSVLKYHEDLQRVRDHGLQQLLAEAREAAGRTA